MWQVIVCKSVFGASLSATPHMTHQGMRDSVGRYGRTSRSSSTSSLLQQERRGLGPSGVPWRLVRRGTKGLT